jgi:hypothetical protein
VPITELCDIPVCPNEATMQKFRLGSPCPHCKMPWKAL